MKCTSVLVIFTSVVSGLQALAEPDQPVAVGENVPSETQEQLEADRYESVPVEKNLVESRQMSLPVPIRLPLHAVECYTCVGCQNLTKNTTTKLCPYSLDPTKKTKCVSYTERYKHMKNPYHIRGCVSERGSCAHIRNTHEMYTDIVTLLDCTECEGNRCNSASLSLVDLTMAFFALVVTPLVAKYTLS